MSDADDEQQTYQDFEKAVNMTPAKLEKWLDSDDSRVVGQEADGHESTGHASGRRIVKIQRTRKADLTSFDYAHMRKVVGYVNRHLAQCPSGDGSETKWRYSLMNWGHDPKK